MIWKDNRGWTFSLGLLDLYFGMFFFFFFYKHASFGFTGCWLMDWSCVDYLWIVVMFCLAVWALILMAPIHCRYIFPGLFWWRGGLIYILDALRVIKYSANVNILVNYSFKLWFTENLALCSSSQILWNALCHIHKHYWNLRAMTRQEFQWWIASVTLYNKVSFVNIIQCII